MFGLTLINFLTRPTSGSSDRFFRQCFVDANGLQHQLGPLWEPLMTCALDGARSADQKAALRSLMPQLGWRAIPEPELARIAVPAILIWGRHDRQTPLAVAQRASSRYGWPLHIIEDAADDPAFEQPGAVVSALCRPCLALIASFSRRIPRTPASSATKATLSRHGQKVWTFRVPRDQRGPALHSRS